MYQTELKALRGRMERLNKALKGLKKTDEEASREWKALHKEMVQQSHEIEWQAFLFATASLGEIAKLVNAQQVQNLAAIQRHAIWTEVPLTRAKLRQLMVSVDERNRQILSEAVTAIDRVEQAHQRENNVDALNRLLDEVKVLQETMTHLGEPGIDPKTVDVLYESTALMGRMAIVVGKGIVEKWSVGASLLEPLTEAGATYIMVMQEERQFAQLRGQFADRQRVRREINQKFGELEDREQFLVTEIRRLDPSANTGPK